jgi:phthalate 4,5-dioxygenase oxygenase subunit
MRDGKGVHTRTIPGTYIPVANRDNDYLMDRAAQEAGATDSVVNGIATQDASLQESMGPIMDRAKEHPTATDSGIVAARGRLMRGARSRRQRGSATGHRSSDPSRPFDLYRAVSQRAVPGSCT